MLTKVERKAALERKMIARADRDAAYVEKRLAKEKRPGSRCTRCSWGWQPSPELRRVAVDGARKDGRKVGTTDPA